MEEIKAKRLNANARRNIETALSKSEIIKIVYNNGKTSFVSVKSVLRGNTDSALLLNTALELAVTTGTADDLILEFSKAREKHIIGKKND